MTLTTLIEKAGLARIATATPATSATQVASKARNVASVATVAVANSARQSSAGARVTAEKARELQRLVALVAKDWPTPEQAEALAVALADPESSLPLFRLLASSLEKTGDPAAESRRTAALAILEEHPERRIAVVATAGDPVQVTVAVRSVVVGEISIPAAQYDPFTLLTMMQQYGHA